MGHHLTPICLLGTEFQFFSSGELLHDNVNIFKTTELSLKRVNKYGEFYTMCFYHNYFIK